PSRPSVCHASLSTRLLRMIRSGMCRLLVRVHARLEGRDAEALHGIDEELVVVAVVEVGLDEAGHDVGHVGGRERGADDLAECRLAALAPADGHLVPLGPLLVDAEDADVAHAMMAARIHAARAVEVELADAMEITQAVEAALHRL